MGRIETLITSGDKDLATQINGAKEVLGARIDGLEGKLEEKVAGQLAGQTAALQNMIEKGLAEGKNAFTEALLAGLESDQFYTLKLANVPWSRRSTRS